MARNGSGTYSLPAGNPVVTGTTISSTVHNNTMTDFASEMTNSVAVDGQSTLTGALKMAGQKVKFDSDGDTSIRADTDDQIDIEIAGADDFQLVANVLRALSGSVFETNTINETTSGSGVTIDSLLIKDGGLDFSSTGDGAGSMASELFDDYEEGTWTPIVADNSLSDEGATYSTQVGRYTKVGNICHVSCRLVLTGLGTLTGGQQTSVIGLPYTCKNVSGYIANGAIWGGAWSGPTAGQNGATRLDANTAYVQLLVHDAAGGTTGLTCTELSASGIVNFQITYEVE